MIRRLTDHAQLVAASDDDPFVGWDCDPRPPLDAWADRDGTAVAFARDSHRWGRSLVAVGPPDAAAELAARLLDITGLPAATVSRPATPQECWAAPLAGLTRLADWDWMWVDTAPRPGAPPAQERVETVRAVAADDPDADAVRALLAQASPRHSADPGDRLVRGWVGVRDPDDASRLLACAAWQERVPGVPHLASIASLPALRGRGLGTAVTGVLTRRLLDAGAPVVTLALYADNLPARRLYDRLGYRPAQRFSTWVR
jgi:ribosomal protein S18 acetylase RimI-like enzyme